MQLLRAVGVRGVRQRVVGAEAEVRRRALTAAWKGLYFMLFMREWLV